MCVCVCARAREPYIFIHNFDLCLSDCSCLMGKVL